MASESAYQEFTGKSVEEALKIACESFKVGLADLDFEIIAPGSKGVLGMGAEPARIVAVAQLFDRYILARVAIKLDDVVIHRWLDTEQLH